MITLQDGLASWRSEAAAFEHDTQPLCHGARKCWTACSTIYSWIFKPWLCVISQSRITRNTFMMNDSDLCVYVFVCVCVEGGGTNLQAKTEGLSAVGDWDVKCKNQEKRFPFPGPFWFQGLFCTKGITMQSKSRTGEDRQERLCNNTIWRSRHSNEWLRQLAACPPAPLLAYRVTQKHNVV